MQLRILVAAIIFVGSYLPLSLILLAQNYDYSAIRRPICWKWFLTDSGCVLPFKTPYFAVGIFLVCLVCFAVTLVTLSIVRTKHTIIIKDARHSSTDLMNYVLPYVVSFMSIDYQETGKFIGFLIFLGWMFWITHKSGQIMLNPMLIAFGWKLYEVSYAFAGDARGTIINNVVLSRLPLIAGQLHRYASIQNVLIVKASRDQGGTIGGPERPERV